MPQSEAYAISFHNGLTVDAITAVTGPGRLVTSFVSSDAGLPGPAQIMQGSGQCDFGTRPG